MKRLIIVRHAKSDWDSPDLPDAERPLNKRGRKDAPRMAKRLKERRVVPDVMISSHALRALTTCIEFAVVLGFPREKIKTDHDLYHADEDRILHVIRKIKDGEDGEVAMIFGHNPGLTDFVTQLLDQPIENIPTCGIISASLPILYWKDIDWKCGQIVFFDYPKLKK